ncbi:MAG: 30S ribosomal protein S6 [Elusimicrobiales bacterium]|nr:30S ribosomal protein S6 [Elusimicrobiales bacterium]
MKTNCYDIVIILNPELTENSLKDIISNKIKKTISSMGGEILTEDNWGIRKLSHPINKKKDGFYYFIKAKLKADSIKDINYNIRITEGVLRVSILKSAVEIVK